MHRGVPSSTHVPVQAAMAGHGSDGAGAGRPSLVGRGAPQPLGGHDRAQTLIGRGGARLRSSRGCHDPRTLPAARAGLSSGAGTPPASMRARQRFALIAGVVAPGCHNAASLSVPVCAVIAAGGVLDVPLGRLITPTRRARTSDDRKSGTRPYGCIYAPLRVACCCSPASPLRVLACCVALFIAPTLHVAVSGRSSLWPPGTRDALMSACVIAAQAVMLPMALLVDARAEQWGRKPLLLAACAVLPIRGVLFTFSMTGTGLWPCSSWTGWANGHLAR